MYDWFALQVTCSDVTLLTHQYRCRHSEVSVAESGSGVATALQTLLYEAAECRRSRQTMIKRRRKGSLLENVSRRIGNVFRRKSLEELIPKKAKHGSTHNCALKETSFVNRRSV
jgi:hypothetical protein